MFSSVLVCMGWYTLLSLGKMIKLEEILQIWIFNYGKSKTLKFLFNSSSIFNIYHHHINGENRLNIRHGHYFWEIGSSGEDGDVNKLINYSEWSGK